MYCKFCGNEIDRKSMKCTACGRPVGPLSGGTGFTDSIRQRQEQPSPPEKDERLQKLLEASRRVEKDVKTLPKKLDIILVAVAVCVLISFISLLSTSIFSGANRRMLKELSLSCETFINDAELRLGNIEARLAQGSQDGFAADGSSSYTAAFSIDKNPESELNMPLGETMLTFVCRASGENLQFSWERYSQANNNWEKITDGDPLFSVSSSENESRLTVVNSSPEHEGTYICVITDSSGVEHYSAPAQISVESEDTANAGPVVPDKVETIGESDFVGDIFPG